MKLTSEEIFDKFLIAIQKDCRLENKEDARVLAEDFCRDYDELIGNNNTRELAQYAFHTLIDEYMLGDEMRAFADFILKEM